MVCLCHGVNERRVRREIEHGAATIEEIAERCLAGSDCYGCHPTIDDLLEEHERRHGRDRPPARLPPRLTTRQERFTAPVRAAFLLVRGIFTAKIDGARRGKRSYGGAHAGDADIIDVLNDVLTAELTAINQYFIHAKMCENWGYHRLEEHGRDESIDEMKHADIVIERILYFDGVPNMQRLYPVRVGETVDRAVPARRRARVRRRRPPQPRHRAGRHQGRQRHPRAARRHPRVGGGPHRLAGDASRRRSARSASSATSPSSCTISPSFHRLSPALP